MFHINNAGFIFYRILSYMNLFIQTLNIGVVHE